MSDQNPRAVFKGHAYYDCVRKQEGIKEHLGEGKSYIASILFKSKRTDGKTLVFLSKSVGKDRA